MDKGIGSIHRIDNPTPLRCSDLLVLLFPENAIIGESSLNASAQASLGLAIGYRHKRVISFAFGDKRTFEMAADNISGLPRQTHGEIQKILEFGLVRDHLLLFPLRLKSSSRTSSRVRPRSTKSTSKW